MDTKHSRKRKNVSDDYIETQRPAKRHGSDNSGSSESPIDSCADSPSGIDSSPKEQLENGCLRRGINSKTYIILSSSSSEDKCQLENMNVVSNNSDITVTKSKSSSHNKSKQEAFVNYAVSSPSVYSGSDDEYIVFDSPIESTPDEYNVHSPEVAEVVEGSWIPKGDKTPHGGKKSTGYKTKLCDSSLQCYITPSSELRVCPLPLFSWADSSDVWKNMCRKDERASLDRDASMFGNHSGLQPRMRAILLDWLIEVCEVYKLHRETYYLTVDYLDRYLTAKKNVSKSQLQLIGITCLFVAAKVEEIYPPKLTEFAYVTDGACTEDDILQQEILLLQAMNWNTSPVTIMGWLNIYMQLNATNCSSPQTPLKQSKAEQILNSSKWIKSFIYPQFSGFDYVRTAQLIDLCSLDIDLANFPYSIIAAAAISHVHNKNVATRVSGLDWGTIAPCAKWMEPYYQVVSEDVVQNPLQLLEQNDAIPAAYGINHICPRVNRDDSHLLQTHTTSMEMFDKGMLRREQLEQTEAMIQQEDSLPCPEGILTPPASNRKSLE